jgi:formate dehydrogenase major subunit
LQLNGKTVHQVAVPYHFGTAGLVQGGAANDLLAISGEPNVTIMEAKALTCNIVPGRLPRGPAFIEFLNKYAPQSGPTVLHPEESPVGASTSGGGGHATEGKD